MSISKCCICRNPHRIGIDSFVLESKYGVLVENSSRILALKDSIRKYKIRYSFAIHDHKRKLDDLEESRVINHLIEVMDSRLGIEKSKYEFHVTMNSIPEHWHIHMCLLPYIVIGNSSEEDLIKYAISNFGDIGLYE